MKKVLGKVPSPAWLIRNGYGCLRKMMWKHPEAFAHLQQDIKPRGESITAHVRTAERLMKKHGKLPHYTWLKAHGHCDLVGAMQRRPDAFSHIHQETRRRSIAKHVEAAERLAQRYGALPHTSWLRAHGQDALIHALYREPSAFAHIRRAKGIKTLVEHVRAAKQLARKYGELPHCFWLLKHGHGDLYNMMRKYPAAFAKIKQATKKGKSRAEHIEEAERLEKKHGRLPHRTWLRIHGHAALARCIAHNPEEFSHIKQDYKGGKGIAAHVKEAETLAKRYGQLPTCSWLIKHGYAALIQARNRRPDAFAHIAQRREFQTRLDRHVQDARGLVKQYGKLPGARWLQTHGYGSLYSAIRKYPERFGVFPRKNKSRRRTPRKWLAEAEKLVKQHGKLPRPYWLQTHGYWGLYAAMRKHPKLFAHLKP
jgi:hypothetical protein